MEKNLSDNHNFRSQNHPQQFSNSNKQFFSGNQRVHHPSVVPTDWNGMEEFYRNGHDHQAKEMVKEKMHEHLFNEENDLMSNHSDSLRSSLDIIKS